MRILIALFCVFVTSFAVADYGDAWGVSGDVAESFIKTLEEVITVEADREGQKEIEIENIYCLVGTRKNSIVYSCTISFGNSNKVHFEGKLAETLYSKLLDSNVKPTNQTDGTSTELKTINCSTIVKNFGHGDFLSSLCSGSKVSIRY